MKFDIASEMFKNLNVNPDTQKLSIAINHLESSLTLLEKAGKFNEVEEVGAVIESLANKIAPKEIKKSASTNAIINNIKNLNKVLCS